MPGDLVEGHAKLETDCSNCHTSFSQDRQSPLCLSCHKEIAADIARPSGFHGRASEVAANDCRHCHTDHVGRTADIVSLDVETFQHRTTDFALVGAHDGLACEACHIAEVKFRDAPGGCIECHRADEPHQGRLGTDCAACHTETAWSTIRVFDHSATKFALQGAHEEVACRECHAAEVYQGLPLTCVGCHRIQDVHRASMGEKCDTCHSPAKWTEVRFDHDKDTRFALLGEHAKAKCTDCHTATVAATEVETACIGCHRDDDPHRAQLGVLCDTCHQPEGWREAVAFDHDITRFPLIGLHVLAPCEACHLDAAYLTTETACTACHSEDDVHKGSLGSSCSSCHNPNGWAFWSFDHDRQTDFSLTGAHDGLACVACHTTSASNSLTRPRICNDCHQADDVHQGHFGADCQLCHGTKKFKGARLQILR